LVPLVQAVNMKETHEHLEDLLQKKRSYEHRWNTCDYLNVIAMVTVYIKFGCF